MDPVVTMESVQGWYNYAGTGKGAIGKIFKENGLDGSNTMPVFVQNGYDAVVIMNTEVGIKEKKILPYEVLITEPEQIKILQDAEKSDRELYHFTTETFDKFSKDMIGTGMGASFGPGFYFSPVDIPEYGQKMRVELNVKNPYVIKDLNDLQEIYNYVNTVLTPGFQPEHKQELDREIAEKIIKEKGMMENMEYTINSFRIEVNHDTSIGPYNFNDREEMQKLVGQITEELENGEHRFFLSQEGTDKVYEITGFDAHGDEFFKTSAAYLPVDMKLEIGALPEAISEALVQYERDEPGEYFGASYLASALHEAFNVACEKDIEKSMEMIKEIDGSVLGRIENQTPEICMAAVQSVGSSLVHVREQTPEICMLAVKKDGMALQYVKEQTPEICAEAVKNNLDAMQYLHNPLPEFEKLSIEDKVLFVTDLGYFTSNAKKDAYKELCNTIVQDSNSDVRKAMVYWAMQTGRFVGAHDGLADKLKKDPNPKVREEFAKWNISRGKQWAPVPKKDKGIDI